MLLNIAKNRNRLLFTILIFIIVLVSIILAVVTLNNKGFYRGITVEGINVSGLDRQEAGRIIDNEMRNIYNTHKIILFNDNGNWVINLRDISLRFLMDETLDQAYKIGRTGNVMNRFYEIIMTRYKRVSFTSGITYDKAGLKQVLESIKSQIDNNDKNAQVKFENGNITIVKEEAGRILDVDENLKMLENNIVKRNFQPCKLVIKNKVPKISYNDIKDINGIIGSFSTFFNPQDYNRSYNIGLACKSIDGIIILPDEIFSMNRALGPRTAENGYREAPVIFKNELVKGTGGGVCQVTTTLYNAVLKSKLQVCARTHHSLPLGYVELGLDATIAEDYIDFQFKNNSKNPICLSAKVEDNSVKISVLGKKDYSGLKIALKSVVVAVYEPRGEEVILDNTVPENERITVKDGKKGYKVIVYRETYNKSGELIDKEKISEDIYAPQKPQVKVNQNYEGDSNSTQ